MPTSSFFCLPSWGSSKSIYKAIETGILLSIVEIKKTVFWNKVPDQIGATIVSHQAHSNLKKGLVNCIGKMRKLAGLFVLISRQISKGSQDFFFSLWYFNFYLYFRCETIVLFAIHFFAYQFWSRWCDTKSTKTESQTALTILIFFIVQGSIIRNKTQILKLFPELQICATV